MLTTWPLIVAVDVVVQEPPLVPQLITADAVLPDAEIVADCPLLGRPDRVLLLKVAMVPSIF